MKQISQSLKDGSISLLECPSPKLLPGHLLIQTRCSLISTGTERMLINFGRANILEKALQQPEKVRQVLDKVSSDGAASTFEAVKNKLDNPLPLGYCNVGTVLKVGPGVKGFKVGDRVASNGYHAELVCVSQTLCALIPDEVSDECAAFTVISAIGLQGIRLAKPTLGETFVVSGLGLIGLLTAQLLKANGCNVLGLDPDSHKCEIAKSIGIKSLNISTSTNPVAWCYEQTSDNGVDGVIITATTSSSGPVETAAEICRQRGRIILVGVTGINLKRDLFYKKELSFQVSCSYGPGRYDPLYEQQGIDYPIGFLRWTEQRNFQAVLNTFKTNNINTFDLLSHKFKIENANKAYELLQNDKSLLGILLEYPKDNNKIENNIFISPKTNEILDNTNKSIVAFIGAGNYAKRFLIPAFKKSGAKLYSVIANNSITPSVVGEQFNFHKAGTDVASLLSDPVCNTVVIVTRHDSHGALVKKALEANKNVFVEKPLCIQQQELDKIKETYLNNINNSKINNKKSACLMVGYNRRFSPLVVKLKEQLSIITSPKAFIYTCNAGYIPKENWTQDPIKGGGRLLGEACHFVDLLRFLAGISIKSLEINYAADTKPCPDTFSIQLTFEDGSIGSIHYYSNGNKGFPKERIEVFTEGKIFQLNNFRKLKAWGVPKFRSLSLLSQDKGQKDCVNEFIKTITSNEFPDPIPFEELFEVQNLLFKAIKS